MENDKNFRILSIDGGGIRGVVPAHILSKISSQWDFNPVEYFDLIAGTSTGSIIAAGIACKIPPDRIIQLYKENGERIFKRSRSWIPGPLKPLVRSTYDNNELKRLLKEVFD